MEGITSRVCFLRRIRATSTDSDTFYVNCKATRVDLSSGWHYATLASRETLICIFPLLRRYHLLQLLTTILQDVHFSSSFFLFLLPLVVKDRVFLSFRNIYFILIVMGCEGRFLIAFGSASMIYSPKALDIMIVS